MAAYSCCTGDNQLELPEAIRKGNIIGNAERTETLNSTCLGGMVEVPGKPPFQITEYFRASAPVGTVRIHRGAEPVENQRKRSRQRRREAIDGAMRGLVKRGVPTVNPIGIIKTLGAGGISQL